MTEHHCWLILGVFLSSRETTIKNWQKELNKVAPWDQKQYFADHGQCRLALKKKWCGLGPSTSKASSFLDIVCGVMVCHVHFTIFYEYIGQKTFNSP